jgi:hypothetical protein
LPPPAALAFGAIYGAVAGAFIAWDIVVLVRLGKILNRRVSEKLDQRRHRGNGVGSIADIPARADVR